MKIHFMSDLHLEFGALQKPLPTGEILILDGDITLARCLPARMTDAQSRGVRKATLDLIEEATANFERVFYVIGNHEAYNFNLSETPGVIRAALEGVTLLNDKVVDLSDNVILVGGTLWTDMNAGKDARHVGRGMNDFRLIDYTVKDRTGTFDTATAMALFKKTKELIARTAKKHPEKTIVVATHHAPSIKGLNPEHAANHYGINAGYYTDLEAFIAERPNIKFWVHGHTHIQTEYRIAQCRVMANCRGYVGREACARTFDPDRWFDTADVEAKSARAQRKASDVSEPVST